MIRKQIFNLSFLFQKLSAKEKTGRERKSDRESMKVFEMKSGFEWRLVMLSTNANCFFILNSRSTVSNRAIPFSGSLCKT